MSTKNDTSLQRLNPLAGPRFHLMEAELQPRRIEENTIQADHLSDLCIHQLFEAQVDRMSNNVAVVFEDKELTYQELNEKSNQLAHHLLQLNVLPDTLVAIYMERSLEMIISILAILKAGAAYLPVDTVYPKERVAFMLADSQAQVLLTQESLAGNLPKHDAHTIYVDTDWTSISHKSIQNPDCPASSRNLAYVIYTSGSTGKPKGCMITHHNVTRLFEATQHWFQFDENDVWTMFHSYAFDFSVWELWGALIYGGRLIVVPYRVSRSPKCFYDLLSQEQVTILNQTPSAFGQLIRTEGTFGMSPDLALRKVIFGGEALNLSSLETWFERHGDQIPQLVNMYGITETTVHVTYRPITVADLENASGSVIGVPIPDLQLYILDQHLQPAPRGVPGEMYVGGAGLSRGYVNRPGLTKERFISNPFYEQAAGRGENTGDLARYLPDGDIEYLGRVDDQVKIRGFRIELGEIEVVLSSHTAIMDAVVVAREDIYGDKRLAAYYVPQDEPVPTVSELRQYLQEKLPDYMIPAVFMALETLPLTHNGKIDRRALPAPDWVRPDMDTAYVAPRTPIEEVLVGIWSETLGFEPVGVYDSFFELGGNSLLATQIISRLQKAFQTNLSLQTLFELPTVADLATLIAEFKDKPAEPIDLPSIVDAPGARHEPFPLTDVQQAYWFGRSSSFELGNVACHSYKEVETDELDIGRFETAVQQLLERHDMLRAVVLPDGRQQILIQVPRYKLKVIDMRGLDIQQVSSQLEAIRWEMSHHMLPSDQAPMFEIQASRLDEQRIRLHISFDVLIADARSFEIFFEELAQLYQNPEVNLPVLELSFRDYVLAALTLQNSEAYQRSQDYWLSRLASLPPAPGLPLAKNPNCVSYPRFVRRSSTLEPKIWRRLKSRAAKAGLTPSGVLLAAFAETLKVWSKNPEFTINLTLFNRLALHSQVNDIIGDFTSLTMLEVNNSAEPTFEARARRLQQQLWDDLDHRYYSGVKVLRELARQNRGSQGAAMPIVFTSILPDQAQGKNPNPMSWLGEPVYSITQTPQVWLDHIIWEEEGILVLNWDAVEELFPGGLLDDMFNAYGRLLHRLADAEDSWQEGRFEMRLKLIPAAQLEQRAAINATEAPISEGLLHTLFTAQIPQQSDQPAVVTPTRTLSYEELYRRTNQVGHWLRQREALPNSLVAVVMEKGWEQIVSVLGILASGAAYLPVDAHLPKERLWYLLKHGNISLALTQSWHDNKLEWPEGIERLCVDNADQLGLDESPLEALQRPEDLAYVIYTSGSTGLPKGVVIDHRGAVNTVLDINQRCGVGPEDRVLALSALNFDLSVYDIFGILAAGGAIVMPAASANRDPAHWAELILREQVTIWDTVPALMQMLVEYLTGRSELLPASLRLVMMSGDWIPLDLPDRIKTLADDIEVFSLGGATEASIWSILYPIKKVDPSWTSIPYGRPMVNQKFHVLNEAFDPCPVWVPGQLYIGGIGLAKGYWRDEEKTQASFISHPRSGERLYRTGDLGRYLPDGNIEFLGREDFQVKIRGHRIELGEIEAALLQHPKVHTAVVAAAGELGGNKRLVAYVVPEKTPVSVNPKEANLLKAEPVEISGPYNSEDQLHDPLERLKFKLRKPGLREFNNSFSVQLIKPQLNDALLDAYISRRSYRKYMEAPIPFEQFSNFLSCLLQVEINGAPFPKYRYGSAGSLYPVQTHLYIKPNRVEGLSAGVYYYHPGRHQLLLISADARITRNDFQESQAIFHAAAFALFLIGQTNAISPMYRDHARDFCLIEAGLMCQLLETSAPANQIGLCQIGGLNFQPIRHLFALEESHVYLHGLLGGMIDAGQTSLQAFVEDIGEIRPLLDLVDVEEGKSEDSASGQRSSLTFPFSQDTKPDHTLVDELREFLGEKLPEYMVPSAVMLLDALPLSSNGKVNRKALPELENNDLASAAAHAAPRTEVERVLAEIWQEIIGIKFVGINDNFFELGGDSVMAIQIVAKANQAGLQITPNQIFEFQTVAELATVDGAAGDIQAEQDRVAEPHIHRQPFDVKDSAPMDGSDFNWTQEDLDDIARAIEKSKGES